MRCDCGGASEVLERRGHRRRRRCLVCGARWTTVEIRVGIKPAALPPNLAKLGKPPKPSKPAKQPIHRRLRSIEDVDLADQDDSDVINDFIRERNHVDSGE